jgi:hypothetical protein
MSGISIFDAAFAGPRAIVRRPVDLLIWYVVMVLISAGMVYIVSDILGPSLGQLQALRAAGPQADPTVVLPILSKVMSGYMVIAPISVVIGAITTAAANRLILRPQDGGVGHFKLGPDELRLMVVLLAIGLIFIVISFVGLIVAGIIGAVIAGATGGAANPAKMQAGVFIGLIPTLLVFMFLGVRLSLAPAQTMATRSINIFGSWSLTRGRFWPILGTYVIGFVIYVVVAVIVGVIGKSLGGAVNASGMPIDLSSSSNLLKPETFGYILLNAVGQVASLLLLGCPGADLYRQIAERPAQAEAF